MWKSLIESEDILGCLKMLENDKESVHNTFVITANDSPMKIKPIFYSVALNKVDVFKNLMDAVDINEVDDYDCSLLHWASGLGNSDIVQLILDHKDIKISLEQFCESPLHYAAENNNIEVVRKLITHMKKKKPVDFGEFINLADFEGRSALDLAQMKGWTDMVQLLLENISQKKENHDLKPSGPPVSQPVIKFSNISTSRIDLSESYPEVQLSSVRRYSLGKSKNNRDSFNKPSDHQTVIQPQTGKYSLNQLQKEKRNPFSPAKVNKSLSEPILKGAIEFKGNLENTITSRQPIEFLFRILRNIYRNRFYLYCAILIYLS